MRNVCCMLLVVVVVSARVGPQRVAAQVAADAKPTSLAAMMIRVTSDPMSGLDDPTVIGTILYGQNIFSRALAQSFPEAAKVPTAEQPRVTLAIGSNSKKGDLPPGVCLLDIKVSSFDERVAAAEFLKNLVGGLQDYLASINDDQLRETQLQIEEAQLRQTLKDKYANLVRLARQNGIPDMTNRADVEASLWRELLAMQIETQGLEVRQRAIRGQIAKLSEHAIETANKDSVVVELERVVELREALVKRLRAAHRTTADALEPGKATSEVNDKMLTAETQFAEAKAERAKFIRLATLAAGGEHVAELERRLADTSIELSEKQVKKESLHALLSADVEEYRQVRISYEAAEEQYRKVVEELNLLHYRQRTQAPSVTVLATSS